MANLTTTTIASTGTLRLPNGTTAQRPVTPAVGMFRFNTDLGYTEYYNGSAWVAQSNSPALLRQNIASGGLISQVGPYKVHTYAYNAMYSDFSQTAVTDTSANSDFIVMKTFVANKTGNIDLKFTAYIQSGTFYFAYRVRVNSSTVIGSGSYANNLYGGDISSVHSYRRFILTNMSVTIGDVVTVEMVSSTGAGVPTLGNGQTLFLKDLVAYQYSDVFIPKMTGTVEVLVIGGGGGGGGSAGDGWNAGGGGGGGVIYNSAFPVVANTIYNVTVGRGGGAGATTSSNNGSVTTQGTSGGNSSFSTLVAIGGGGGGASSGVTGGQGSKNNGLSGGSGGGAGVSYSSSFTAGGTGTTAQGFAGGTSSTTGNGYGAGGGGAGSIGATNTTGGVGGGLGLVYAVNGRPEYYSWGGNTGQVYPSDAPDGSGAGGDASFNPASVFVHSGAGGSGVVIVRYINVEPVAVTQTFTNVGTMAWIAPAGVTRVEALVVGGGGGGGNRFGGGGGAGGLVYNSSYLVVPGRSYTITVGDGGSGGTSNSVRGSSGSNSVFDRLVAFGGGGGASESQAALSGGSGGGGSYATPTAGTGTALQGNAGGTGRDGPRANGGGGGAGSGGYGLGTRANGGDGLPLSISGETRYYAGGGGGADNRIDSAGFGSPPYGIGGSGGGGNGGGGESSGQCDSKPGQGEDGLANTGGGGGGGAYNPVPATGRNGGNGGSGIVILRWYP
jgi:hypothetical protein